MRIDASASALCIWVEALDSLLSKSVLTFVLSDSVLLPVHTLPDEVGLEFGGCRVKLVSPVLFLITMTPLMHVSTVARHYPRYLGSGSGRSSGLRCDGHFLCKIRLISNRAIAITAILDLHTVIRPAV